MDCKHEFIGHAEGVTCSLCGLKMTQEEFRKYLKGEKVQEEVAPKEPKVAPKKTTKKK